VRALLQSLLCAVAVIAMSACGGGGGGGGGDDDGSPEPGGPVDTRSCREDFTPERVNARENCSPTLNRYAFCPAIPESQYLTSRTAVIPCVGVTVSSHTASGGGFNNVKYLAIRPSTGQPEAVYLALHYLDAPIEYYTNLIRLQELAKARNVLVLVPQAPSAINSLPIAGLPLPAEIRVLSRWPTQASQPVESYLQLLDAVVTSARGLFNAQNIPLYAAGLSNGAPMAYFYACGRAQNVDAILSVAGNQQAANLAVCRPSQPVGVVIIHGTGDVIAAYNGLPGGLSMPVPEIYTAFRSLDQCTGADQNAALTSSAGRTEIRFTLPCANARRVVLAATLGDGHNWPGDDQAPLAGLPLDLFGPTKDVIDATIQGYDLMRFAAGN